MRAPVSKYDGEHTDIHEIPASTWWKQMKRQGGSGDYVDYFTTYNNADKGLEVILIPCLFFLYYKYYALYYIYFITIYYLSKYFFLQHKYFKILFHTRNPYQYEWQ